MQGKIFTSYCTWRSRRSYLKSSLMLLIFSLRRLSAQATLRSRVRTRPSLMFIKAEYVPFSMLAMHFVRSSSTPDTVVAVMLRRFIHSLSLFKSAQNLASSNPHQATCLHKKSKSICRPSLGLFYSTFLFRSLRPPRRLRYNNTTFSRPYTNKFAVVLLHSLYLKGIDSGALIRQSNLR